MTPEHTPRWLDSMERGDVPAGPGYDAWRTRLLSEVEFQALSPGAGLSHAQLRYLATFGLLAPTSHNTVPQRFRLRPDEKRIEVVVDRRFVLPASDPTGRQCLISVGCTLANIEVAASVLGLAVRTQFATLAPHAVTPLSKRDSAPARYVPVLYLELERAAPSLDMGWLDLLRRHKVLRAEYDRTVMLPAPLEARLEQVVRSSSGSTGSLELHLIKDAPTLRAIGRFQEQADRFVFENAGFTRELAEWLIPNDRAKADLGMRGREFGFDDAFSTHVHLALRGERPLLPDQLAGFAKGGRMGLESSSAVALISVEHDAAETLVRAGRAAQLLSLELLHEDFYSAFHAALTEVEWAREMVAASVLNSQRKPVVVLRMGKPKRLEDSRRPHSSRPPVDQVLLD